MQNSNIDEGILQQEGAYWDAMKSQDVERAISLTAFPCVISGPQGVHEVNESEYRAIMQKSNMAKFKNVEILEPQVTSLSDDVKMIIYKTEVGGMHMLDVSTWVKDSDKWLCKFHSENPILR